MDPLDFASAEWKRRLANAAKHTGRLAWADLMVEPEESDPPFEADPWAKACSSAEAPTSWGDVADACGCYSPSASTRCSSTTSSRPMILCLPRVALAPAQSLGLVVEAGIDRRGALFEKSCVAQSSSRRSHGSDWQTLAKKQEAALVPARVDVDSHAQQLSAPRAENLREIAELKTNMVECIWSPVASMVSEVTHAAVERGLSNVSAKFLALVFDLPSHPIQKKAVGPRDSRNPKRQSGETLLPDDLVDPETVLCNFAPGVEDVVPSIGFLTHPAHAALMAASWSSYLSAFSMVESMNFHGRD